MAITSLATLTTAVQNWRFGRSDTAFTDRIPEFVSLAESRLNVDLQIRTAEVNTTLTGSTSSRQLTLPSDYLEPIALFLTTWGTQEKLAPIVAGNYELGTSDGVPVAWMINGAYIDLDVPCDQAHTFLFRYRMKLLDLNTTSPNWLLTNHPDVYLFAVLVEAADFDADNEAMMKYEGRLRKAVERVGWLEARSKSVSRLRVDPALSGRGSYNINSDS